MTSPGGRGSVRTYQRAARTEPRPPDPIKKLGPLSEIMPPREPFTPVPIQGEPLSETIIHERLIAAPKIARPQEA